MKLLGILIIILGFINIFLKKQQYIIIILSIELILIGLSLYFLYISLDIDNITGLLFTIIILLIGATESAIGLSILIIYYKRET